jgi:multicomponent Na+:H+ antiporter subunit F
MILSTTTVLIVVAMVLALLRAMLGPTVYDRILALNSFGTLAALMIAVVVFFLGSPDFLDIALLYVLINFIGPIAILRFFERGTFDDTTPEQAEMPK